MLSGEQLKALDRIGELETKHCQGCKKILTFGQNTRSQECIIKCEFGKEIAELGILFGGKGQTQAGRGRAPKKNIKKDDYLKLKADGITEREVISILKISTHTLGKLKKEWGILKQKKTC